MSDQQNIKKILAKPENVGLVVSGAIVVFALLFALVSLPAGRQIKTSPLSVPNSQPTLTPISTPNPVIITNSTPKASNNQKGQDYLTDTQERLHKASDAIEELIAIIKASASTPSSEQTRWQKRLDEALLALSDEGNLLMQMPFTVSANGEKVNLSKSVERLRKTREALGEEMVSYTYYLRESMPLLTEQDDRPVDPVKFRAATKRFGKVTSLYEETTKAFAVAKHDVR